jgi:hypothetical protein
MYHDEPTKGAKVLRFFAGLGIVCMFALPIAGIVQNIAAKNEAERQWRDTVRRENEKTDKVINGLKRAIEKRKNEMK